MRRRLVSSLCVLVGISLAGCSTSAIKTGENEDALKVWLYVTEDEFDDFNKIVNEWAEANNQQVEASRKEGDISEYIAKSLDDNGPDIVWGAGGEEIAQLFDYDLIEEVDTGYIDNNEYLTEDLVQAASIEGKQYSFPISQETVAVYYNKDLVDKVPDTMEQLVEIGKEKGFYYGITDAYLSMGFITSGNCYLFGKDGDSYNIKDVGMNNSDAEKIYQFIGDLVLKDKLMPEDVNDNIGNAQFYNGNSAFYLATSRQMAGFRNAAVNFSVMPIPTLYGNEVKPYKQIDVAFVSPKSNKKDNSYKLLADILDNSSEIVWSKGNQIPVLKKYAENKNLANDEILQGFIDQCNNAVIVPDIFEMTSVWNVVNTNLSVLIQGDVTAKQCADNIQSQIEENIDFSRGN